eukprot:CFRG7870T1
MAMTTWWTGTFISLKSSAVTTQTVMLSMDTLMMSVKSQEEMDTENSELLGEQKLNIHRMFAKHPALMRAYWPLREHIVRANSLPPRYHEILILRVAYRTKCRYEWEHHLIRGELVGLTKEEIELVKQERGEWLSRNDNLIIQCADELHANDMLSPKTKQMMTSLFGNEGVLDAIMTVSIYRAMAAILLTFDVPIDDLDGES